MSGTILDNHKQLNPIRQWRLSAGIGQQQLATMLRVSIVSVSRWETGGQKPGADNMEILARMMGRPDLASEYEQWLAQLSAIYNKAAEVA